MISKADIKLYKLILVGHLVINLPVIFICIIIPFSLSLEFENLVLKMIAIVVGVIIGVIITWFLWSYLVGKWKLWAFNKVKESEMIKLHELAVENKLVWGSESEFEILNTRSESEKLELDEISERINILEQLDKVRLDLSTSFLKGYKLSKLENLAESLSMILIALISIGMLFTKYYFLGIIMLAIIFYDLKRFNYLFSLFHNRNYLELTNEGIQIGLKEDGFIRWEDVESIRIDKERRTITILKQEKTGIEKIKFELWRLDSYKYNDFKKYLTVFIDRHNLKYLS